MEHMMTFRKLGLLTTTHPSHRIIIKKVPWYFSNFAKNTLTTPFFNKKSTRCTFRILPKTPYPPPLFKKKSSFLQKKSVFLRTKDPWYFSKFQKKTPTPSNMMLRFIDYFTNFYSEVCIMNMLLSQAIWTYEGLVMILEMKAK